MQCEQAINVSYLMAGEAFKEIRDRRLYLVKYGSFEVYCQDEHQRSKRHVNRLIRAYELYVEQKGNLGPMGPAFAERHYRELAKLKTRATRTAAVMEIRSRFDEAPTAEQVREVVEAMLGKRREPEKPFVREAKTEKPHIEAYEEEQEEAYEGFYMKPKHLEEDVETIIDTYSRYLSLEQVCNLVIETAARLRDESGESDRPKQPSQKKDA